MGGKIKEEDKHDIFCEVCGKAKKVARHWAKYCSLKCKTKGWARRVCKEESKKKPSLEW